MKYTDFYHFDSGDQWIVPFAPPTNELFLVHQSILLDEKSTKLHFLRVDSNKATHSHSTALECEENYTRKTLTHILLNENEFSTQNYWHFSLAF